MVHKRIVYECDNCGAEFFWSGEYIKVHPTHMVMPPSPMIVGVTLNISPITESAAASGVTEHLCRECDDLFRGMWKNNARKKKK